jgi:hypothetical protein
MDLTLIPHQSLDHVAVTVMNINARHARAQERYILQSEDHFQQLNHGKSATARMQRVASLLSTTFFVIFFPEHWVQCEAPLLSMNVLNMRTF